MLVKFLANTREIKSITNYNENITLTLKSGEKVALKAENRDDDSVMETLLAYLRN